MAELLLVYSHVLAFSVLFIDSLFDFFNDHDIPDEFAVAGVIGGVTLHSAQSYFTGNPDAIIWSLGVGAVFSVYGWVAYWKGMWGGADAFAMSALGFAAPGPVSGLFNTAYLLDTVFNFVISATAVTVIYSGYKFIQQGGNPRIFIDRILEDEKFLAAALLGTGGLSALLEYQRLNGYIFFTLITGLLLLYETLSVIEKDFMVSTVKTEELEGGEVPARGEGFGKKIKGLSEDEIESIDTKEIKIRTGVPFLPVFLLALLLTDLTSSGIWLFYTIY